MRQQPSDMADIDAAIGGIAKEFAAIGDWLGKYEHVVAQGRALAPMAPGGKTDANRVHGCQSQVWLAAEARGGRIYFTGDSDALVVKGLLALLFRVYSGRTPAAILATPPDFIEAADLGSHITGNRASGLTSIVRAIKARAETEARAETTANGIQ